MSQICILLFISPLMSQICIPSLVYIATDESVLHPTLVYIATDESFGISFLVYNLSVLSGPIWDSVSCFYRHRNVILGFRFTLSLNSPDGLVCFLFYRYMSLAIWYLDASFNARLTAHYFNRRYRLLYGTYLFSRKISSNYTGFVRTVSVLRSSSCERREKCFIYQRYQLQLLLRMFQDNCAWIRNNLPWVKLHW